MCSPYSEESGVRTFTGSRTASVDATFSDHADDCTDNGFPRPQGYVMNLTAIANGEPPVQDFLTYVNFTKAGADGSMQASASILTLDPCGGPSTDHPTTVSFPILKGETVVDIRLLVDRSVVEAFVMGGRESTSPAC